MTSNALKSTFHKMKIILLFITSVYTCTPFLRLQLKVRSEWGCSECKEALEYCRHQHTWESASFIKSVIQKMNLTEL